ncbi:MAG: cell division protein FtsA [Segetibacter sp.]
MQELSRYAVGLDVGTFKVRCVVAHQDAGATAPVIIGIGEAPNSGMRKGVVVNLVNTAQAIDKALEEAERVSGHDISSATISINGSHVLGVSSRGVVAVGSHGHEINEEDLARAEEAATVMQLPANREILEVTPRSFRLDDQDNIRDPIGMTGVRLEVDAHVITALTPNLRNLQKTAEMTHTEVHQTVPAGLAAAQTVLSEEQKENGALLIDIGHATTNLAVYEEGDLQHVAVITMGGASITNDLAVGLKVDLKVAEEVKVKHAVASPSQRAATDKKTVTIKQDKETHEFTAEEVDFIVEARLEELFELINKELTSIGRAAKLPGGVIITGGSAQIKGLADYTKEALQLAAKIGIPEGFGGVAEYINQPQYAVVLGLMLFDLEGDANHKNDGKPRGGAGLSVGLGKASSTVRQLLGKFKP